MILVHMPSLSDEDRALDLYALAPDGASAEAALNVAHAAIVKANAIDLRCVSCGEAPPVCVEDMIRQELNAAGFRFLDPAAGTRVTTPPWDGDYAVS